MSDLLTIIAVDKDSSDTCTRTFSTKSSESFKNSVESFERELTYRKYELMCDEFIDDYNQEIIDVLDELEVTV